MPSAAYTVESHKIETSDGVKLHTRIFKREQENEGDKDNLVIVLVHPYSVLAGCQALLKGIAGGLASRGYKAVTFDMRGAGKSTGRASLTGFKEIEDVVAVCKWVSDNLSADRILLVGSSAGGKSVNSSPKMTSLWQRAITSGKASVLDEIDLSPDDILSKVEKFDITSRAIEHSYPAVIYSNIEQVNYLKDNNHCENEAFDDDYDNVEELESSVPLGSLRIDLMANQLSDSEG